MATELKGEALLDYYQEAVRVRFGNEVADKSILIYDRPLYYVNRARTFPDGSIGIISALHPIQYRAAEVREMADELLRRALEAANESPN